MSVAAPPRRLDPCPCGSGKRYRDCHGALSQAPLDPALQRAIGLRAEGRGDEALAAVAVSLDASRASPDWLNLRGLLQQDLLQLDAAIASFEGAIAAAPRFAEAHFNLSLALLLVGDYRRGWPEYEWRTRVPNYADYAHYPFGMPRWQGEPLAGRRLLVHAEQGQGDAVQFARFLTRLAAQDVEIEVFCHPPLAGLMARVPGVVRARSELAERPTQDFHAPMLDVAAAMLPDTGAPHWFGAWLQPLPERVERFRTLLAGVPGPRIGLAWKGSPRHLNDRNRSLDAASAREIAAWGAQLVSVQVGEPAPDPGVFDAAAHIRDWEDTVAVLSLLDGLVSVDTAVAHVAGSLGKPVHLLLPFSPDWRWGLEGETTRWYPSMRLYRQRARGDWKPVLARVAAAVGDMRPDAPAAS